jgi:omega-hydroxy-beta-dihydromenaquinone-9 sulfotransferase
MSDRPGLWTRPLFNINLAGWRRLFARYPEHIERRLRIRAIATGTLSSALAAMQERLFAAQLDAVRLEDPVFIVGHWRSGTTLLHELMALDQHLLSPTTRQCFNPHSFLLSGKSAGSGRAVVRPSGDRAVSSESPQEEEFALLCLGCASPYEAFVFSSAMRNISALSDPEEFSEEDRGKWEHSLIMFLKGVSVSGGAGRLLLKSPTNTFRIAAIRRLFPTAPIVQIVRNPAPVIVSAMDLWNRMWDRYALGPRPDNAELRETVVDTWIAMEKKLRDQIQECRGGAFTIIKYEELVARPYETIERIYSELKLGTCSSAERVSSFLAESPQLRPSAPLEPGLEAALRKRCAGIFDQYGY